MAATADPRRAAVAVAMIVATAWSTAPLVAALATRTPRVTAPPSEEGPDDEGTPATVTTVIRVGDEPDALVAGAVAIAREAGPVALVGRRPSVDLGDAVLDRCDEPAASALHRVAQDASTPALVVVSGRTAVRPEGARRAAARVRDGCGWATGTTRSFNADRFAPDRREQVAGVLRRRACATGLWLWEPDATVVATALVRDDPPAPGRTDGHWLRRQVAEGHRGVVTADEPAVRAAPVSSRDHWPDTVARQRAAAADVADALVARHGAGGWRSRLVAGALLLRELYAWPLLVWLAAPVLLAAGMPFRVTPAPGAALLVGLAVARWAALRHLLGMPLQPRGDVLAAVTALPGSLWALPAALRRRVRRPSVALPARPLVWAALVGTVVAGVGLVNVTPGTPGSRTVALLCITLLVGLWVLTVRSLVERTWERTSFRVPVSLAVTVAGHPGTIVDASPAGVGVEVDDPVTLRRGDEVGLELVGPATSSIVELSGVVATRRIRPGRSILGIELHVDGVARERWIQCLAAAVTERDTAPGDTAPGDTALGHAAPTQAERSAGDTGDAARGHTVATWVDRATLVTVTAVSVVVITALVLVLLGFRPLVVRSGSMAPAYHAGDVVLTDRVQVDDLELGDVVTLDHYVPIGESLTHRVQSIDRTGSTVQVTTRGDANETAETWSADAEQLVGRVVASVPAVGRPAIAVRTSAPAAAVATLGIAALVALLVWGRRRPRDIAPPRHRRPTPARGRDPT